MFRKGNKQLSTIYCIISFSQFCPNCPGLNPCRWQMSFISIHNMLDTNTRILSLYISVPKGWTLVRNTLGPPSQKSVNLQGCNKINFVRVLGRVRDHFPLRTIFFIYWFIYLAVLGTKHRALHMLDKCSVTDLYPLDSIASDSLSQDGEPTQCKERNKETTTLVCEFVQPARERGICRFDYSYPPHF